MELSATATVLIGLVMAAWTFAAAFAVLKSRQAMEQAREARAVARRLARMLDQAAALPLLVRGDGGIEGPERLAAWLGLDALPHYLSELTGTDHGLRSDDLKALEHASGLTVRTAAPFRMTVTPQASSRRIAISGQRAHRLVSPTPAALVWWVDVTPGKGDDKKANAAGAPVHGNSGHREPEPAAIGRDEPSVTPA